MKRELEPEKLKRIQLIRNKWIRTRLSADLEYCINIFDETGVEGDDGHRMLSNQNIIWFSSDFQSIWILVGRQFSHILWHNLSRLFRLRSDVIIFHQIPQISQHSIEPQAILEMILKLLNKIPLICEMHTNSQRKYVQKRKC